MWNKFRSMAAREMRSRSRLVVLCIPLVPLSTRTMPPLRGDLWPRVRPGAAHMSIHLAHLPTTTMRHPYTNQPMMMHIRSDNNPFWKIFSSLQTFVWIPVPVPVFISWPQYRTGILITYRYR
jgi:hypothetical protein